jgi:hypothetical protein
MTAPFLALADGTLVHTSPRVDQTLAKVTDLFVRLPQPVLDDLLVKQTVPRLPASTREQLLAVLLSLHSLTGAGDVSTVDTRIEAPVDEVTPDLLLQLPQPILTHLLKQIVPRLPAATREQLLAALLNAPSPAPSQN